MSTTILQQPLMATFFAYFDPKKRLGSHDILFLICCPVHRSEDVRQKLENEGLTLSKATSREYLIPRHHKAFVFVSGGIDFARSKDKGHIFLRLVQTLSTQFCPKYYLDKTFWFVLYHPCSTDVPEMARVKVWLFLLFLVNFIPIISKYAPARPKPWIEVKSDPLVIHHPANYVSLQVWW